MTYFLQLLAIICRFNYANAPANLGYYEILLDVALFDIDILKPSCVIGWTSRGASARRSRTRTFT